MVLAHEIAHVAQSHVTNGMKANAGTNMLGQLAGRAVMALAVVKLSYPPLRIGAEEPLPDLYLSASNCDCLKISDDS